MSIRTVESLIAEFRSKVHQRIPVLLARARGEQMLFEVRFPSEPDRYHSAIWWIHRAHIGTLEKLDGMLRREGEYETFELLALARNIFENLVWLRLMNKESQFGIVFYAQYIRNEVENYEAHIRKIADEAELFESVESLDEHALDSTMGKRIREGGGYNKALMFEAMAAHKLQTDMLDDLVRREFILFSLHATQNGYDYQAHLLRTQVIPEYEARLADAVIRQQLLTTALPMLVDARCLGLATNRWNWADRAREVQMEKHYRFLYSFTSKLLHSTPLNIITEKALSESEAMIVLDYIVISAGDLLKQVDDFRYPGQIKAAVVDVP